MNYSITLTKTGSSFLLIWSRFSGRKFIQLTSITYIFILFIWLPSYSLQTALEAISDLIFQIIVLNYLCSHVSLACNCPHRLITVFYGWKWPPTPSPPPTWIYRPFTSLPLSRRTKEKLEVAIRRQVSSAQMPRRTWPNLTRWPHVPWTKVNWTVANLPKSQLNKTLFTKRQLNSILKWTKSWVNKFPLLSWILQQISIEQYSGGVISWVEDSVCFILEFAFLPFLPLSPLECKFQKQNMNLTFDPINDFTHI